MVINGVVPVQYPNWSCTQAYHVNVSRGQFIKNVEAKQNEWTFSADRKQLLYAGTGTQH